MFSVKRKEIVYTCLILGPLLPETLDVRRIPFTQARQLTVSLTGMIYTILEDYFKRSSQFSCHCIRGIITSPLATSRLDRGDNSGKDGGSIPSPDCTCSVDIS